MSSENDKSKIVKLMISVIILIVIALVGTYALTIWRSTENTELTLRIGDISGFYCTKGDNIEINNIGPIFDYTIDGESTTFSIDNQTNETANVTVKFHITTITDNLKEESFKYVLMTNTNNSSYTVYTEGNFKDVTNSSNITLLDNYEVGLSTRVSFKLVIYIDGNMENPITMQGGSLVGYLDACKEENPNGNLDNSGANIPVLADGMIPVTSDGGSVWVKADTEIGDTVTATCDALGDIDGDGYVTSSDSLLVKDYLSNNQYFSDKQKVCADVDEDGFITMADVDWILEGSVGKSLPKHPILSSVEGTVSNNRFNWYSYDGGVWANAVLVSEGTRQKYISAEPGTAIQKDDILAFYVWIPRFKYKVWNINKVMDTDSYNAQTTGIDIVFEEGTNSTGTISCTYSYAAPSSTAGSPNETCIGNNGDYYTHPAFTFGNQELTGFWMGKFELSSSNPATGTSYGGGNSTTLTPRILPNVTSWRNNPVSNYWKVIYDMQTSNNIYGLPTSRTNTDSHMLTNMEWGAVAYLTNSKYGRCTNGSCTEVLLNAYGEDTNYTTKTGCGPIDIDDKTSYEETCYSYFSQNGTYASTTGNVSGVYDMSGGAGEYVMGNMSSSNGTSYTYQANNAGSNFIYSADTAKYITPYAYGTTNSDQTAYNRGRLGDATGEVAKYSGFGWYSAGSYFPHSSNFWLFRGGNFRTGSYSVPFYFNENNGTGNISSSTRAALTIAP